MQSLALPPRSQYHPNTVTPQPINKQRMGTLCWQRLVNQGVPFKDARELAIAIIHFIYLDTPPSQAQKDLIDRYYQHICAAKLSSLQF